MKFGCQIKALHVFYRGDNQFAILAQQPFGRRDIEKARASLQIMYDMVKGEIRRLRPPTRRKDTREGPLNAAIEISVGAFVGNFCDKADNCDKWLAYANDAVMRVKALKDEALDKKAKVMALEHILNSDDRAMKYKALQDRYQSALESREEPEEEEEEPPSSLWIRDLAQHKDKHIAEFRFFGPVPGLISKGTEKTEEAEQYDNNEEYESALPLYELGREYLEAGLKYESNSNTRAIEMMLQNNLWRIEHIRRRLNRAA